MEPSTYTSFMLLHFSGTGRIRCPITKSPFSLDCLAWDFPDLKWVIPFVKEYTQQMWTRRFGCKVSREGLKNLCLDSNYGSLNCHQLERTTLHWKCAILPSRGGCFTASFLLNTLVSLVFHKFSEWRNVEIQILDNFTWDQINFNSCQSLNVGNLFYSSCSMSYLWFMPHSKYGSLNSQGKDQIKITLNVDNW